MAVGAGTVAALGAEVGLVLYPGCQIGMVYGVTDLFMIASQFSLDRGGKALRVSHWSVDEARTFTRTFDTHPDQARRSSSATSLPRDTSMLQIHIRWPPERQN